MSSRHRSDPAGSGHWALIGAMVATVIALAIIGGYALYYALNTASPTTKPTPSSPPSASVPDAASPSPTGPPPALTIRVTGDFCDVFVGIPQGDVLINERLDRGDVITFDEPRLSAVVSNGAAAEVTVNGELQPPGEVGERQDFTIEKESEAPKDSAPSAAGPAA